MDPNVGWEMLKLLDRSMFNIGAIGFEVDVDEAAEFALLKLFDLTAVLQTSTLTNGGAGAVVIVDGDGINVDVDGYVYGECSEVNEAFA